MSKAIYTRLNGKLSQIDQNTIEPSILNSLPSQDSVSTTMDDRLKIVTETVKISDMETECIKTNAELYNIMIEDLKRNGTTQIQFVSNNFQVYVDYAICSDGCELTHSVAIKPISAKDVAILLGVATNNELVYRRAKLLTNKIMFGIQNVIPLGIMDSAKKNYKFIINDITVYQDLSTLNKSVHNSIYENPTNYCNTKSSCMKCYTGHSTINDSLMGFTPVFSTSAANMKIANVDINFVPRKIIVDLQLVLSDYIVVYDDADVIKVIQDNIDKKYEKDPENPHGSDDPAHIPHHKKERYPDADGDETPDENGHYDYYERCLSTTPDALLVVEELISDRLYNPRKMIKIDKIIKDIPDISVGEYVHYVEVFVDSADGTSTNTVIIDKPKHHHHHHHCPCNGEDNTNTENNDGGNENNTTPAEETTDPSTDPVDDSGNTDSTTDGTDSSSTDDSEDDDDIIMIDVNDIHA